MSNAYTIIVADDHPLFRAALTQAIGAQVDGAKPLSKCASNSDLR